MMLFDGLLRRVESHEMEPALRFLDDGDVEGPQTTWTAADLHHRAMGIAERLRAGGQTDRPVLLVYPPGLDFVAGFLGCQYARAIPVPVYPPNPSDLERATARIQAIAEDCGAEILLTTEMVEQLAMAAGDRLGTLARYAWISTDTLGADAGYGWKRPSMDGDTKAFLQYTSGSTGSPKGVVVRHGELAFHMAACIRVLGFRNHMVSWLPTYHDMGLIGGVLTPLCHGVPVTLMAPYAFLMQPTRWMRAVSHFRADCTPGPNFGYHLAARKTTAADLVGLDLSCLRAAVIGAEPISPLMLEDFARVFAPAGLDPAALYPAYGMAEATLMISTKSAHRPPVVFAFDRAALARNEARPAAANGVATPLVGCGQSLPEQSVIIADPETQLRLPDGRVGEILVSGASVAREYWERPGSHEDVFAVPVAGEGLRYLRTGDLGFIWENEIYVSGRTKDLLIIRGRNYAPADLEATLEAGLGEAWGLRPGRVVAVSTPTDEGEAAVILAELRSEIDVGARTALASEIATRIAEHHGVSIQAVSLLRRGAIPLTSSGKVQRRAARQAFLDGTLDEIARVSLTRAVPAVVRYGSVENIHRKLDTRAMDYLFDLERDVPWDQLGAPGLYLPATLLTLFGIDPSALARKREIYQTFQWALALSICRTFEHLEWGIIQFARKQAASLPASRSLENLCVEEEKHIQLFRRIAAHLSATRPTLAARFDEAYASSFAFLQRLFASSEGTELHYRIWLTTLFFEPATLHLATELEMSEEPLQPVWRRAHALHAQEEKQHVSTVAQYALALQVERVQRENLGSLFIGDLQRGFRHLYGLTAPLALVRALWPDALPAPSVDDGEGVPPPFVDELLHHADFKPLNRILPGLAALTAQGAPAPARPEVIFVLSSERAGSTLLRVMLSAHPDLFSPPEMNLLGFATLGARATGLPLVQQGGLVTAVAALEGLDEGAAAARVQAWVDENTTTEAVFQTLVAGAGHRVLVDKSPIYSRDLSALRRAEAIFGDRARYVFLTRHPYAVVDSYARVGLQRLVAERLSGEADPTSLGEMGWTLSNRTIQSFLAEVPPARWCTLHFEDLVAEPGPEMARICAFLRLPYAATVLEPYRFGQMTGPSDVRSAVGDPNFQKHRGIDPALGEAWRGVRLARPLGAEAQRVATELGYVLNTARVTPVVAVASASPDAAAAVRAMVCEVVAVASRRSPEDLDDDTAFATLGLDSLDLVQLTNTLQMRLGRPLPAMTLYDRRTIGELVAWLGQGSDLAEAAPRRPVVFADERDLGAEVWLPDEVCPAAAPATVSDLFLTGATGFLGAWLLHGLLQRGDATVHCLVRASDAETGLARLRCNLERYGLPVESLGARVSVVTGDLGAPRFGLDERSFDALAERVGAIYHNGALLHFGMDYAGLAPANVASMHDVLRLATQTTLKPVHHVSSMSVFDTFQHWDGAVDERTAMHDWRGIRLGYAQTKWVAERLAALAASRGVPVSIYRCAGIAGDTQRGTWNTTDLICRMIKGCIEMGHAPKLSFDLDMAPVDSISNALVWLSQTQRPGGVYHLNHARPIPWKRLVSWLQFQGYELEVEDHDAWVERLNREARSPDHPLASLVPFFTARLAPDGLTQLQTREHRPKVGNAQTTAVLARGGLAVPALDNALLSVWFDRFVADGYLPTV